MAIELKIPSVGESITEVEIGQWLKSEGDAVNKDENLVAIESEKATVELPSPISGALTRIVKRQGERVTVGETIAWLEPAQKPVAENKTPRKLEKAPVAPPPKEEPPLAAPAPVPEPKKEESPPPTAKPPVPAGREEETVRMSLLRRTVARRLVEGQRAMAMLTTFNEIDLSGVIALRREYQETFTRKHGVKLGFMSFFVKAAVEALKAVPQLNASVQGDEVIYHNYYDIGIAIGGDKGLVVPTLRNAERLSFAEVEKAVADFAARARENKLKPDELQSGTFTITNGGVYGSLLSTPIVNPPQSGIFGMHTIQERPVARGGAVVIRPMMYVALSYDHRIVDGREAVSFVVRLKDLIENPARILLEI